VTISDAQLATLIKSANTTVISGDSLPTFRGRKRPNEPYFEEKNTNAHHLALVKSYIQTLNSSTEQDKKQLLVRSADKKLGDFHITVSGLVNGELYREATFDEIVEVLENIYTPKSNRNIASVCSDLKASTLRDDETLTSQIVDYFGKLSEVSKHLLEDPKLQLLNKIPVRDPADTNDTFREKQKKFIKDVINNAIYFTQISPQFSEGVQNKILDGEFQTTEGLLSKAVKVIRELPVQKKAIAQRSETAVVLMAEDTERNDDHVETYMARSAHGERGGRGSYHRGQARGGDDPTRRTGAV
jgi:hypothetical protein